MDSICVKNIDEIFNKYNGQELVCSSIGFQHVGINSSNFGSVKNSKIIKSIIDSLLVQYEEIGIEEIEYLDFGFPENYTFSEIAQNNIDKIYFNEEYFSHAMEYKTEFNPNTTVFINNDEINYSTLCKTNNWPIYYI